MSVEYSPLCAYDLRAYLAYCSAKSSNVADLFGQVGVLADVDGDNSGSGTNVGSNVLLVSAKTLDVSYAQLEESCRGCVECDRVGPLVRATRIGGTVAWTDTVGCGFTVHGFCGRAHLVSRGLVTNIGTNIANIDGQSLGVAREQRVGGCDAGGPVCCAVGCGVGCNMVVAHAPECGSGLSGGGAGTIDSGVCRNFVVNTGSDVSTGVSRDSAVDSHVSGVGRDIIDNVLRDQCAEKAEKAVKYVLPQRRGPNGGQSIGRGKNYDKNQAARVRRRQAKESKDSRTDYGTFAACSLDQREELQRSRAERLVAENRLKTAEACQRLALVQSQDLAQLKKRQETKLMRDTELNKVQVEQAFGKLAGTGNVPGFAQTVVTDGSVPMLQSGSISPNSSISLAEVHAMQKENLELQRRQGLLLKENPELYAKLNAVKLPSEQTGWTVDENGCPTGWIGDAVGGMIGPDGRLHDYDDYAEY